jgi:hypothetical protein
MANAIACRPSDDVTANATITVQAGTEDSDYPATNLADTNPAKPAKLTTTTGRWVFDFGSAQTIQLVALIHHNLDAGLTVKVQANATDSWGSPSLDTAITIPTLPEDSYPLNPWLDLSGSVHNYRYWAIYVSGTNSAAVAIGKVCLIATKRSLTRNIQWGSAEREERPAVEHRTVYGVSTVYTLGPRLRAVTGMIRANQTALSELLALERDADHRGTPFLFILDPAVNDALYVRWASPPFVHVNQFLQVRPVQVTFEEISRGLRL